MKSSRSDRVNATARSSLSEAQDSARIQVLILNLVFQSVGPRWTEGDSYRFGSGLMVGLLPMLCARFVSRKKPGGWSISGVDAEAGLSAAP
jgi:hypothetical protein